LRILSFGPFPSQLINGTEGILIIRRNKVLMLAAAGAGGRLAWRALRPKYDLRGRNVLITGGSRGLGLVMARECLAQGARVAICARDPDELERAREELAQRGGFVYAAPCDLTDQDMVNRLVHNINTATARTGSPRRRWA
jgi:D-arabinose 1-dehydrogenase-like Zn-dependent alcohol dehydrogenase